MQFCFPPNLGRAREIEQFSIVPIWEYVQGDERAEIKGIYHVTASVQFEEGACEQIGILIDDVDLEDCCGYFEYGYPLTVDMPNDKGQPKQILTKNLQSEVSDTGIVLFSCDIELQCEPVLMQAEEQPTQVLEALHEEEIQYMPTQAAAKEETHMERDIEEVMEKVQNDNIQANANSRVTSVQENVQQSESLEATEQDLPKRKQPSVIIDEFSFLANLQETYTIFKNLNKVREK